MHLNIFGAHTVRNSEKCITNTKKAQNPQKCHTPHPDLVGAPTLAPQVQHDTKETAHETHTEQNHTDAPIHEAEAHPDETHIATSPAG